MIFANNETPRKNRMGPHYMLYDSMCHWFASRMHCDCITGNHLINQLVSRKHWPSLSRSVIGPWQGRASDSSCQRLKTRSWVVTVGSENWTRNPSGTSGTCFQSDSPYFKEWCSTVASEGCPCTTDKAKNLIINTIAIDNEVAVPNLGL